ncbi:unnamed protein product [Cladocopium goreaui]|uniref:Uncharacterized protein n=1 Tax=Cladocopium goreaui TaxID=2562237 RepID=A0A9P1FLP0_9DINO|nr:unnamed protein product [Cladocopium goreaui]
MPLGRWNDDEDSSSCGGCQRPAAGNRRRYDPTESSEPEASVNDSGSESLSSDSDAGSDAEQLTSEVVELSLQRLQTERSPSFEDCIGYVLLCAHVLEDHPKSLLEISDEQLRENLLARLIDAKLMGPGLQVGFNHDPEGLPERKLPHGNFATLYIMYESFCKAAGEEPASRTVFYQVGKRWKVCLRFHKPSVHSKCWTCSTLKARIANAIDFQEHTRLADELLFHYSQQWKDRQVYWLARSRSRTERDMMTMIIDSFDHCKLMLPRFPNRRSPKSSVYETIKRTSMTLTCAICHGWGIYFFWLMKASHKGPTGRLKLHLG